MSHTGRHRYKNRRERLKQGERNFKVVALFIIIAVLILLFKNRVAIYDHISLWFY